MEERYRRNIPALAETECALLRTKQVLIVGCGGLGGHLLDQLLRIGVGAIRICDGDVFEETNLNRQLLSDLSRLGSSKVLAAKAHGRRVNPAVVLDARDEPMTRETVFDLLQGCDIVLDALDNVESRRILSQACADAGIPYVFGAIGGWVAQAAISLPGDNLIQTLYPEGSVIPDKSVLSFTPALCASLQTSLCVKWLTGRPVKTGILCHFDLLNQEFEEIPLI